jgi:hypothetical protein
MFLGCNSDLISAFITFHGQFCKVRYDMSATKLELHQKNDIERGVVDADVQFCSPCLPTRQGYCVLIHHRVYSSLRDFGP